MGAFAFKLERDDVTPADPPTPKTVVPNWEAGDTIPRGPGPDATRVIEIRPATGDDDEPVLVVEDVG